MPSTPAERSVPSTPLSSHGRNISTLLNVSSPPVVFVDQSSPNGRRGAKYASGRAQRVTGGSVQERRIPIVVVECQGEISAPELQAGSIRKSAADMAGTPDIKGLASQFKDTATEKEDTDGQSMVLSDEVKDDEEHKNFVVQDASESKFSLSNDASITNVYRYNGGPAESQEIEATQHEGNDASDDLNSSLEHPMALDQYGVDDSREESYSSTLSTPSRNSLTSVLPIAVHVGVKAHIH